MNKRKIAKIQHYIPQFLLRNFGSGTKKSLHVFDKLNGNTFQSNTKNVAAESGFYNFQLQGQEYTSEDALSRLESATKPIIDSILQKDSIGHLTPELRASLSCFLSIQLVRTKAFRESFKAMTALLRDALSKSKLDAHAKKQLSEPDENELAVTTSEFLTAADRDYAKQFNNKIWLLASTDHQHSFLIGDNPITMQNYFPRPNRGNLGLGVEGIEIQFPLSPKRALCMLCPTLIHRAKVAARGLGPSSDPGRLVSASQNGSALSFRAENVENFNYLQVRYSERFLFSSDENFDLARRMIKQDSAYRTGPRVEIG